MAGNTLETKFLLVNFQRSPTMNRSFPYVYRALFGLEFNRAIVKSQLSLADEICMNRLCVFSINSNSNRFGHSTGRPSAACCCFHLVTQEFSYRKFSNFGWQRESERVNREEDGSGLEFSD